jgi:hypothetical protein
MITLCCQYLLLNYGCLKYSAISETTGDYVQIRSRVGSVLEVGEGFHSELSCREGI